MSKMHCLHSILPVRMNTISGQLTTSLLPLSLTVLTQSRSSNISVPSRRNEPLVPVCPMLGEVAYPARRWGTERTFSWLNKRRAIRIRWTKNVCNWLALLQFACAYLLVDMAFYG